MGENLVPQTFSKMVPSSPNWLKYGTGVHCYIFISNLMLIFQNICHSYFFGQIWSQNLKFSKLNEILYRDTLLHAYYDFHVYFFKILSFILFWANLVPKSNVLQIDWNLIQGHIVICWLRFWCVIFRSICRS